MKHQSLREVHQLADIQPDAPARQSTLSRTQRLERWAQVLADHGASLLNSLEGTEYRRPEQRAAMRRDGSPIALAFADGVLRREGLADDSYGEAKRFFGLADYELHYIVCHCHCGARMSGLAAAERVRAVTPTGSWLRDLAGRIQRWFH